MQTHFYFIYIYILYTYIYTSLKTGCQRHHAHFNSIHTMHIPPHSVQQEAYAGLTDKG